MLTLSIHHIYNSENTTLKGTPGYRNPDEIDLPPGEDLSPAPIEQDIDEWVFLDREKLDSQPEAAPEEGRRSLGGKTSLCIALDVEE